MLVFRTLSAAIALAFVLPLALSAQTQTTTRVSLDSAGQESTGPSRQAVISASGQFVAFVSAAALVPGDTNGVEDVYVRDLVSGTTVCASVGLSGLPGSGISGSPSIRSDGRAVVFDSQASDLVPGDTNGVMDVFVRDLVAGTTTRVSVSNAGLEGNGASRDPALSANGNSVVFSSAATNLVAGDTNGQLDVFVRDLGGSIALVSHPNSSAQSNGASYSPAIAPDGSFIAFLSTASNLDAVHPDTNGVADAFLFDRAYSIVSRISTTPAGVQPNAPVLPPLSISVAAEFISFTTSADNLVPGDTNGLPDVFARDPWEDTLQCLSADPAGIPAGGHGCDLGGTFCAVFSSASSNLVAGDTNGATDTFWRNLSSGAVVRVSVSSFGAQASGASGAWNSCAGGRFAVFESQAADLVVGDTNGTSDIFVRDLGQLASTPFCLGDGTQATPCPCANSGSQGMGCANSAYASGAGLVIFGFAVPDSVQLQSFHTPPTALTVFLQGSAQAPQPLDFGDGLRCVAGSVLRLYARTASAGSATAPLQGDLPLGQRSAQLGDPLAPGTTRYYQAWYRDPITSYCAAPAGNTWNITSGLRVDW